MASPPHTSAKIHRTEEIYRGSKFAFVLEKITLPNGVDTELAFVRHPGSAVIVPVFADKSIGLIKQFRHPVNDVIYEVPAGTMHPGEDPLHCAKRELEEETGTVAAEFIYLGWTYLLPAYTNERSYIYLASRLTETAQNLDQTEIIETRRCSIQEVQDMIDSGKLVDALSILAITRAIRYIEQQEV